MSKLHFLCVLALLLLIITIEMKAPPASASLKGLNAQQRRRGLQGFRHGEQSPLAMELISFDHIKSPFSRPDITKKERALMAVQRSHLRAQSLMGIPVGQGKVFSSPMVHRSVSDNQGSFFMNFTIGTPPRNFLAIVNTNVELVSVNCQGSNEPDAPDAFFNRSASSTYKQIRCQDAECLSLFTSTSHLSLACPADGTGECEYDYSDTYSITDAGFLSHETISLIFTNGSTSTFPGFHFGCGSNHTDTSSTVTVPRSAVVGLGQGNLSLVGQLKSQIGNIFSYCLVDWETNPDKTSLLLLGSAGPVPLNYTPLLTNIYRPTSYYVNVLGITIGDKAVSYPPGIFNITEEGGDGGWIVDSDITLTIMTKDAYTPFLSELRSAINYSETISTVFDLCYDISGIGNASFPTVVFHLQDVNVTLPFENIFLSVDDLGIVCLAFEGNVGLANILGQIWQQNFRIAYDLEHQKLGIASANCSLSK